MKVALLINKDNFEKYACAVPANWELVHMGNGVPDVEKVIATNAEVLVVDAVMKIGADIINHMPGLKMIHSQGVAYNAIDLEAAARKGIFVCNNPGINAQAVAEQTILLILSLLKNFRHNEDMVYAGRQIEAKMACFKNGLPELGSLSVGIVGMGAIGMELAKRLNAFGCSMSYYDSVKKPDCGVPFKELYDLYKSSDIVSLHVPVLPQTENMINDESLSKFKKGAILINTARGELMDHNAVVRAIVSGQLSGLGTDTLSPEPVLSDNPFLVAIPEEYKNRVSLSPHVAGITSGFFMRAYAHVFKNIAAIEKAEHPDSVVNGI